MKRLRSDTAPRYDTISVLPTQVQYHNGWYSNHINLIYPKCKYVAKKMHTYTTKTKVAQNIKQIENTKLKIMFFITPLLNRYNYRVNHRLKLKYTILLFLILLLLNINRLKCVNKSKWFPCPYRQRHKNHSGFCNRVYRHRYRTQNWWIEDSLLSDALATHVINLMTDKLKPTGNSHTHGTT